MKIMSALTIVLVTLIFISIQLSATDEKHFFSNFQPDQRYIVLIISRLGLANRLRSLADWHTVSLLSNRTLLVSWAATVDCNATFQSLFEAAPPNFKLLPFSLPAEDEGVKFVEESAKKHNISVRSIYKAQEASMWKKKGSFIISKDVVESATVVVTSFDGILALDGVSCVQYSKLHSAFLSQLRPIQRLEGLRREVREIFFSRQIMVGVHYRGFDSGHDWAVVPPIMGQSHAYRFEQGASLDLFAATMQKIQAKLSYNDSTGTLRPSVRFFVASNSPDAKKFFLDRFPGAVSLGGDQTRGSQNGIEFALLEWLLLADSALLLHTYGSTFALEAGHVKGAPLVGVWDGRLIYHGHVMQPFCGNNQFVKASGSQGMAFSFTEDTVDNRKIESVAIPMKVSSVLSEWGIEEVFSISSDEEAARLMRK